MGGHKSLIQEQSHSFKEPGPQDSCVAFFVSSQALRISSNDCTLGLRLDSVACLLSQSAGWELGLHSEVPPPPPPKMREGGEQLCHIQQSGQWVSVTSVHLLICKGALCFINQVMGCRFYCVCFWTYTHFAIRYSIPRIRQLCVLLFCLERYWGLNSEPMLGKHPHLSYIPSP